MPKCILSGQVKSTFTQEQADDRYIQMTNGATTTLASSLQVSGINNIEFTEEGEEPITASNVSYSNTTSGMTSGNVQNAIDELFQSVSEGKSLIAAAVTDKGVETAATDSFATMAGNIGQISSGGGGSLESAHVVLANYDYYMPNPQPGYGIHYTKPDGTYSVAQYQDETSNLELDVLKGSFIVPYMYVDFDGVPSGGISYIIESAYNDGTGTTFSIYLVNGNGTIG